MSTVGTDDVEISQVVNKTELARILGCSRPTIADLIAKYPELPIVQKGEQGREWLFDPRMVIDFLKHKREDEAAAAMAHEAFLSGFSLPFEDDLPAGVSPAQRLASAKAALLENKLGLERQHLLLVSDVRATTTTAIGHLGKFLDELPRQIGRKHALPDPVVRAIHESINEARRNLVRDLQTLLGKDHPPE